MVATPTFPSSHAARHHTCEIVPAEKGVRASVSDPPADHGGPKGV